MRKDLVDLTLVVDRSGSMQTIRDDAEGGINAFIQDQAAGEGEAVLTLVEFDSEYDFVHQAVPVKDVPPYVLTPRGSTALLDAVGRAINETGLRLAKMPEAERPGLVVFVVMTDGQENASREFKLVDVRKMIEEQQSIYNWQFTFLGADADAFAEGAKMGLSGKGQARFAKEKVARAYSHASQKIGRMRRQVASSQEVDNSFTDEELNDMQ